MMYQCLIKKDIQRGLSTEVIGKKIVVYKEVDSTNRRAIELAEKGEDEGTVIISETQSKGRGRLGRSWLSPLGVGIYLSIILRPKIPPKESFLIVFLTGIAVIESIKKVTSLSPTLKWPNDILVNDKKIGGILIEMKSKKDKIDYLVDGIGVNVNTDTSLFPKEIQEKSTSLKKVIGKDIDRNRLIKKILYFFEKWYLEYINKGKDKILREYHKYANIMGRLVRVNELKRSIEGTVIGINENGLLLLKVNNKIEKISSGDITFIDK